MFHKLQTTKFHKKRQTFSETAEMTLHLPMKPTGRSKMATEPNLTGVLRFVQDPNNFYRESINIFSMVLFAVTRQNEIDRKRFF